MAMFLITTGYVLQLVLFAWFMLGFVLSVIKGCGRERPLFWKVVWRVLKYPAAVGCFGLIVSDTVQHVTPGGIDYGLTAWSVFCWYVSRDDHNDDDFKKWLKKLAGKIKEVSGKLIVVPEPA